MGRLSLEQASAPSQRASREQRAAEAEAAAWQIKHDEVLKALEEERRQRTRERHEKEQLLRELKKFEAPSLAGCRGAIDKLEKNSSAFYEHVDFLYKYEPLKRSRFEPSDVAARARGQITD